MNISNQLPQIVPALGYQLLEQGIPQQQVAQTLNSLHIEGNRNIVFQDSHNNQVNLLLPLDNPQMVQRLAKRIALHLQPNPIPHHIGDSWHPNMVFYGRTQDIEKITQQLRNHRTTLLLNGIGGMGKTALANQLRYQIGDQYDHVIWTNLQNTPDKDEKVLQNHLLYGSFQLHQDLGIADVLRNERNEAQKWTILIHSLKQLGSAVLWIIDNAHQQDHNTINSLPDNCHILLTSRHTIENIPTHYVNELEEDDALFLFKHYYHRPDEDHTILDVCHAVGFHTLSIELLAKTLNELPNKDAAFLLQGLKNRGINIKRQQQVWTNYAQRETYLNECLLAAFDLGKLMEQPNLHPLMRFFCLMPYQDIAYSVVEQLTQTEDDEAEDELLHHLQQLSKLGWIKLSRTNWLGTTQKSWRMHTIVQDMVQQQLGHDENLEDGVTNVLYKASFKHYKKHHIEAQEWRSFLETIVKKIDRKIIPIVGCYDVLSHLLNAIGHYDKALLNHQKTLNIAEQILPAQHRDLASLFMNMGVTYQQLAQYNIALAYYERCRVIYEQVLPAKHPDLATIYMNIASIYNYLTQYDTALAYYERCRAIREQILPAQHPDLASLYNNIGFAYEHLNKCETALAYYERSRTIREQILPAQHPDLATPYMNIANTYQKLTQYKAALAYYQRCQAIYEQTLPAKHINLSILYENMAQLFNKQSQFSEAQTYIDKAVAIYQQILSPEHLYLREALELQNTIHQHLQPQ